MRGGKPHVPIVLVLVSVSVLGYFVIVIVLVTVLGSSRVRYQDIADTKVSGHR